MDVEQEVLAPLPPQQSAAAAVAFEADRRIRQKVMMLRVIWLDLAEELYRFARGELWRDLNFPTFEAWLADPGVELKRRRVFELIAIYEQLVVERGVTKERLAGIKVSKVSEVLPAIRRGEVQLEVGLADAEVLTRPELETRYRGLASSSTSGTVDTSSVIDTAAEPAYATCPTCGSTYRVRQS